MLAFAVCSRQLLLALLYLLYPCSRTQPTLLRDDVGWIERIVKPSLINLYTIKMRTYIRAKSKGGLYFFTVNLNKRKNNDLLVSHVGLLREAFRNTKQNHPFTIDAIVILPEHLHCIWQLPEGDNDFSTRWRLIKSYFSRNIPNNGIISKSRK